jgi:hypothetical protein
MSNSYPDRPVGDRTYDRNALNAQAGSRRVSDSRKCYAVRRGETVSGAQSLTD